MGQKDKGVWWRKFARQRQGAKQRGIAWLFTFEEWCELWRKSGKWEQRGRRKGQYVMARHGDTGPYSPKNVRICLGRQNLQEDASKYVARGYFAPGYQKRWWRTATPKERAEKRSLMCEGYTPAVRAKMSAIGKATATGRRMVVRDGKRTWSYPGDEDYPI